MGVAILSGARDRVSWSPYAWRRRDDGDAMKRRWLAAGLGLLLAWSAGAQAQPPETFGTSGPPARKEKKPVRPLPSEKMGVKLRTVPEVRLPAIDREKLLREDEAARGRGKALR